MNTKPFVWHSSSSVYNYTFQLLIQVVNLQVIMHSIKLKYTTHTYTQKKLMLNVFNILQIITNVSLNHLDREQGNYLILGGIHLSNCIQHYFYSGKEIQNANGNIYLHIYLNVMNLAPFLLLKLLYYPFYEPLLSNLFLHTIQQIIVGLIKRIISKMKLSVFLSQINQFPQNFLKKLMHSLYYYQCTQ